MKRGGQQAEAGDALGYCSPGQGKDVSAREITGKVVSVNDQKDVSVIIVKRNYVIVSDQQGC